MKNGSFPLNWVLGILVSAPAISWSITMDTHLHFPPVPSDVIRAEVRVTNSSGTLLAGNIQWPNDNATGLPISRPVFWLFNGYDWRMEDLTHRLGDATIGFYTFSDMSIGLGQEWLVGRAWRNTHVEGFAYNLVSQELIWGGTIGTVPPNLIGTVFTGVNDDGQYFVGSGLVTDENAPNGFRREPILYDRTVESPASVVVTYSEPYIGGWLYTVRGSGESTVGIGWLTLWDEATESTQSIPARWTPSEGMVPIDFPENGSGEPTKLNEDGTMAYGASTDANGLQLPSVWYLNEGGRLERFDLPDSPNHPFGESNGFSANKSFLSTSIGWVENPDDTSSGVEFRSFIYTEGESPIPARDFLLENYKIDVANRSIRSISWSPGGGSIFGMYTTGEKILPYTILVRPRIAGYRIVPPMAGGDYYGEARTISNDGKTIAGVSSGYPFGRVSAFWKEGSGWEHFEMPQNATYTPFFLTAQGMSPDGRFIVGRNPSDFATPLAFISQDGNPTYLPRLNNNPGSFSVATGVSADGSVVVGRATVADSDQAHAYVYRDGTLTTLPYPDGSIQSWAYRVSNDGTIAVGWAVDANQSGTPLKWDLEMNNYTPLTLPQNAVGGDIVAISGDGSTAGGTSFFLEGDVLLHKPTIWNLDTGQPTLIPLLDGYNRGMVWSINHDGSLVGGQCFDDSTSLGFVFNDGTTRTLQRYMREKFNTLLDPEFNPEIIIMSDNGEWFTGTAEDPFVPNAISSISYRIKAISDNPVDTFGEDAQPIGTSSFSRTWFGRLDNTTFPRVFHEFHGWLELGAWNSDGGYFFDLKLGWMHVDRFHYPFMLKMNSDGTEEWLFYDEGSINPRRFYRYLVNDWVSESQF